MNRTSAWVVALALTTVVAGAPVLAAAKPDLIVDASDSPLVIRGKRSDPESFTAPLRLYEKGGVTTSFRVLTTDLKTPDGDNKIARSDVKVTGPRKIKKGSELDLQVSISNVKELGTYEGDIIFRLPKQALKDALRARLEVRVDEPAITPVGPETVTLEVVRCKYVCGLKNLIPGVLQQDEYRFAFENTNRTVVEVEDASVFVTRDAKYNVADEFVVTPAAFDLPAIGKVTVPLTILRGRLQPGRYEGHVKLDLKGVDEPVRRNFVVNTRGEPLWALLLLLFGIAIGRLAKAKEKKSIVEGQARQQLDLAPAQAPLRSNHPFLHWVQRIVKFVSGVATALNKQFLRLLLWSFGFAFIAAAGFYTTYVKDGATWGSNVIVDAAAMLAFGLSAQVTGATLSNLPKIE